MRWESEVTGYIRDAPEIMKILIFTNTVIFSLLSLLHFYWAFEGTVWLDSVLPTNSSGVKMLTPTTPITLLVAFGLFGFALTIAGNQGFFDRYLDRSYFRYGTLMIAAIFLLRAIGEFRFVGFFKTVTETPFAKYDSMIFSPLCLAIAINSFLIFILHQRK